MESSEPEVAESQAASEQQLLQACSDGDIPTLQRHVHALSKPDGSVPPSWPSSQEPLFKQMLLAAIATQSTETISYLLTTLPQMSVKEDSILLAALETRSIPILTLLLQHEPTVINHELEGMTTLLTTSFSSSDPTIPGFLLDNGADPNLGTVAHMSPLFFAIGAQQPLPVIIKMVDKGADASKDRLAITEAVRTGRADVLGVLVDAGADVNDNGGREGGELLHLAVKDGKVNAVRLLIEKKADLGRVNEQGKTAYEVARAKGLNEISEMLKRKKGRLSWQFWRKGRS